MSEPTRCECGLLATIGGLCSDCAPVCTHGDLIARLKAFGRDCVHHGDMTPGARRMLERILMGAS